MEESVYEDEQRCLTLPREYLMLAEEDLVAEGRRWTVQMTALSEGNVAEGPFLRCSMRHFVQKLEIKRTVFSNA